MGLKRIVKAIGKAVATPFVKLFRAVFSVAGQKLLARAAQAALKTPLGGLVLAVVEEIENLKQGETGAEKHAAALQKILQEAARLKLQWKESFVNLLIELAVQRMKGAL